MCRLVCVAHSCIFGRNGLWCVPGTHVPPVYYMYVFNICFQQPCMFVCVTYYVLRVVLEGFVIYMMTQLHLRDSDVVYLHVRMYSVCFCFLISWISASVMLLQSLRSMDLSSLHTVKISLTAFIVILLQRERSMEVTS